jgi:integrase
LLLRRLAIQLPDALYAPVTFRGTSKQDLRCHWLYMPTVLAAYTGMRRGEVLGLRWRDIDFDKGTLQIAQTIELIGGKICVTAPKTERSFRTINLPASLLRSKPLCG